MPSSFQFVHGCLISVWLFLFRCAAFGAAVAPLATDIEVSHVPKQPKTGERVVVTVDVPASVKRDDLAFEYQVVEPGKYIELLHRGGVEYEGRYLW